MHRAKLLVLLLAICVPAAAVSLSQDIRNGETCRYKVAVQVSGKAVLPGHAGPVPVDSSFDLIMKVRQVKGASSRVSDRVTVESERAYITANGQRVQVGKDDFPDLTIFLDRSGGYTRVVPADDLPYRLPGLNYRNLVLLLRTFAPVGDLKSGSVWKQKVTFPGVSDPLEFAFSLASVDEKASPAVARLKADVRVLAPSDSKCVARGLLTSEFSLPAVRLEKSRVDMTVTWDGGVDAVVTVEMTRIPS